MIIYRVLNKINNKSYIGLTIRSLEQRINRHLYSKHGILPKALRKYGIQSFEFSIIDTATSIEILKEKEKYWISFYNTLTPKGYNMTEGGDSGGMLGKYHSEESRKKMSKAHLGQICKHKGKKLKRKVKLIA